MKRIFPILIISFAIFSMSACTNQKADLKNGVWRATLKTALGAEIPFNFEVLDSAGKKHFDIINGKERFRVDEVTIKEDSVYIQMPLFDSEIKAVFEGNNLVGKWIKHLATEDVAMIFKAQPDESWRFFKTNVTTEKNISGRWSASFISTDKKDTTVAVGEFQQNSNKLTGTFLTSTGDYRFLEGTVSDNKLYLSCFDGSNAYLFTAKLQNDSTLVEGTFYSGFSSVEKWSAKRDEHALLPDAYSLTALKAGSSSIDFNFPDLNGKKVSLSDNKFKDKVVIVQFFGSWCPNCMDETAYLAPFYKKYQDKGVEIVGLAYERSTDFNVAKKNVERLKNRFDVTYDLLITGYSNDKIEVAKSLPMLNNFVAFPTVMIIGKDGKVRKIHTGFAGPGTGNYYTEFVSEFEETIKTLIAENN
ncbi:peroxiredoxin family protein [Daejeonella oryzae]|uniref:peroxiredoxin family protein n=1 Tax=Daejeonella oryzae TaxID=1122943 RepID=UPI000478F3AD|nr:TlpA disulfide reductase family protein [Daejeonella oryzae]